MFGPLERQSQAPDIAPVVAHQLKDPAAAGRGVSPRGENGSERAKKLTR